MHGRSIVLFHWQQDVIHYVGLYVHGHYAVRMTCIWQCYGLMQYNMFATTLGRGSHNARPTVCSSALSQ